MAARQDFYFLFLNLSKSRRKKQWIYGRLAPLCRKVYHSCGGGQGLSLRCMSSLAASLYSLSIKVLFLKEAHGSRYFSIISHEEKNFQRFFQQQLFTVQETRLNTTFHLQMDGLSKAVNTVQKQIFDAPQKNQNSTCAGFFWSKIGLTLHTLKQLLLRHSTVKTQSHLTVARWNHNP